MSSNQDFPSKLKSLGLKAVEKAKQGVNEVKESAQTILLEEQLRRRFNFENPYKFVVQNKKKEVNVIDEVRARHAKKYEEDDLFVFYGKKEDNPYEVGDFIIDLSNKSEYCIVKCLEVTVPVTLNDKVYDVDGTAFVCELI